MPIHHIHAFVAHPRKGAKEVEVPNGVEVPLSGRLFDLLDTIYVKADEECTAGITFRPTSDGKQQNDCRDLICAYLADSTIDTGAAIAERLEVYTDGRSGLGLMFLIAGKEGHNHKVLISRFPTDNAIYVDEDAKKLKVEFLERVFLKKKTSYKAVVYQDASLKAGMWGGRAIDKQLNNPTGDVPDYWIVDFLASELTLTAARGSRRFAGAMRDAAKISDRAIKQEIVAAATLAPNFEGKNISIDEFGKQVGLSAPAQAAIAGTLQSPRLTKERFRVDATEFRAVIGFRSIELDNGAVLTAPSSQFDEVFDQEPVDGSETRVRFSTEGEVVNERLKAKS